MAGVAQDRINAWLSDDGGHTWRQIRVNPRSLIGHWLRGQNTQELDELDDGYGNLYRATKPEQA